MNYYDQIKEQLLSNEINRKVKNYSINKSDLTTYYNVGKMLVEAGKHYGEGIIKKYAEQLTQDLGKGYTETRLKYYRRFYEVFAKCPTLSDKLSYSHYCEVMWIKNYSKISYYINLSIEQNLSVRQLRERIKLNEYERLPNATKESFKHEVESSVVDFVKNPIIIKNKSGLKSISEKVLQKIILEDIPSFLKELGEGFTFIDNEYPVKLGNRYNYIDFLLYNIKYHCYVVIELKITELKKEHTGQIMTYMNYIDEHLKTISENKTVGIIICKQDNKYVIKYCSDERIISRVYKLI